MKNKSLLKLVKREPEGYKIRKVLINAKQIKDANTQIILNKIGIGALLACLALAIVAF